MPCEAPVTRRDPAGVIGRSTPGGRFSLNAAWNSAWSEVVISSAWVIASSSIAAPIGMSSSRVISDLVCA